MVKNNLVMGMKMKLDTCFTSHIEIKPQISMILNVKRNISKPLVVLKLPNPVTF